MTFVTWFPHVLIQNHSALWRKQTKHQTVPECAGSLQSSTPAPHELAYRFTASPLATTTAWVLSPCYICILLINTK